MDNENSSPRSSDEDEYIRHMRSFRRAMSIVTALLVLAAAVYYAVK